MVSLIVLDDDNVFRKTLCRALEGRGYEVFSAETGAEAMKAVSERPFDAALIDMKMPGADGFQVLKELKGIQPSINGIILTGYGSIQDAVKTMKLGGYQYLTKPCEIEEIEEVLKRVSGDGENDRGRNLHVEKYHGIVGASTGIRSLIRLIRKVKDSSLPVLITGESGTGKELVARALHYDSIRKDHPFVAINCATLKPELLENEFFGHVRGAFTGAVDFKEGLVKAADNGTLFIDEIADMNLVVQASLLRFIETGVFRPIGSNREVNVRTRIIAAINRNIEEEVRAKRFRHDLYYRLNVCRLHIPPLRERPEDIPVLVRHFLASYAASTGREVVPSSEAIERLAWHTWPGNVRELFHTLQRVLVMLTSGENSISKNDVDIALKSHTGTSVRDLRPVTSLDENEKRYILASLNAHNWNISRTATVLGLDRRTLQRKISRYHISR